MINKNMTEEYTSDITNSIEYCVDFYKPTSVFSEMYLLKAFFKTNFDCYTPVDNLDQCFRAVIFSTDRNYKKETDEFIRKNGILTFKVVVKYIDDDEKLKIFYENDKKNKNIDEDMTYEGYILNIKKTASKYLEFISYLENEVMTDEQKKIVKVMELQYGDNIKNKGWIFS
jgi:hypothetical protein